MTIPLQSIVDDVLRVHPLFQVAWVEESVATFGVDLPGWRFRILLIDDCFTLLHLRRRILESVGYEVVSVSHRAQISDHALQDVDGIVLSHESVEYLNEKTAKIFRSYPEMPVIIPVWSFMDDLSEQVRQIPPSPKALIETLADIRNSRGPTVELRVLTKDWKPVAKFRKLLRYSIGWAF